MSPAQNLVDTACSQPARSGIPEFLIWDQKSRFANFYENSNKNNTKHTAPMAA
jgi:hypothetical protein